MTHDTGDPWSLGHHVGDKRIEKIEIIKGGGPVRAITTLLDAGKTDGTVRDDADARDVILLIGYLARLDETEWDARANHVLDIILDGLRRRA